MGSIGKLEHRCTTTNLPLCNDTIIVLKLILLHSVSVMTNFVIPRHDKKQTKKHHAFSSTAGARPRIPTILRMVIEEVRPIFYYLDDRDRFRCSVSCNALYGRRRKEAQTTVLLSEEPTVAAILSRWHLTHEICSRYSL